LDLAGIFAESITFMSRTREQGTGLFRVGLVVPHNVEQTPKRQ
jgi:hypothetical protein